MNRCVLQLTFSTVLMSAYLASLRNQQTSCRQFLWPTLLLMDETSMGWPCTLFQHVYPFRALLLQFRLFPTRTYMHIHIVCMQPCARERHNILHHCVSSNVNLHTLCTPESVGGHPASQDGANRVQQPEVCGNSGGGGRAEGEGTARERRYVSISLCTLPVILVT